MTHTLKLYRASAGSGKTYRLSLEFLKLLVRNPYGYNRILAVTFTNKATTEMQTRIMADLFAVSRRLDEPLLNTLQDELNNEKEEDAEQLSTQKIVQNATIALFNILHDYNHFQVSTIDSFFQIILRNLAHELGLGAYLNIVIDHEDTLEDAILLLKENFKTNKHLRQWMNDFSDEQLSESKSWNLDDILRTFGSNIFKEVYKNKEDAIEDLLDEKIIKSYKASLKDKQTKAIQEIRDLVGKFDSLLAENGIGVDDLKYGKNGVYAYIKQFKQDPIDLTPIAAKKRAYEGAYGDNPTNAWIKKNNGKSSIIETELIPLMIEIEETRKKNAVDIYSCRLILKQINTLGLLKEISQNVREINAKRGQFLLGDTPNLLSSMIDGSDTPFIFEKIGTTLDHIMIDEFQDTSQTQWKNFHPLINECISKNKMNLIVGDAKQSIYRFRNGDWRIIESLHDDFKGIEPTILQAKDNWRSMERIVEFNNRLFAPSEEDGSNTTQTSPILSPFFETDDHELLRKLNSVYIHSKQNCPKAVQKGKGYVEVEFLSDSKAKIATEEIGIEADLMSRQVLDKIISLQEEGVRAKDITILAKNGKDITNIANYFSDYRNTYKDRIEENGWNLDIISDEAYMLSSSTALTMLIDAMKVCIQPYDKISMLELYSNYRQITDTSLEFNDTLGNLHYEEEPEYQNLKTAVEELRNLPLYEMAEELVSLLQLEKLENESSFLFTFMDYMNEFVSRKSPDLSRFLEYWDKYLCKKKIPMSDGSDGIHIMTIHKSKGLEFHTVIVPYCDWNIFGDPHHKPLLWCDTHDIAPYNQLPIVPVEFDKSKLGETIFDEEFREEKIEQLVDSINLLYVAFTRAVNNLLILCYYSDAKELKTVSQLLDKLIFAPNANCSSSDVSENEEIIKCYRNGELIGSTSSGTGTEESDENGNPFKSHAKAIPCTFHYNKRRATFRNSNKADEYIQGVIEAEADKADARKRGILLHNLFSRIKTETDIENAVVEMQFEGWISTDGEKEELTNFAHDRIKEHPEWFKPNLKIFNECSILSLDETTGKAKVSRPDRVIQKGNRMIVIDFKSGMRKKSHERQINEYAYLLQGMGYETETHLWYITEDAKTAQR